MAADGKFFGLISLEKEVRLDFSNQLQKRWRT